MEVLYKPVTEVRSVESVYYEQRRRSPLVMCGHGLLAFEVESFGADFR